MSDKPTVRQVSPERFSACVDFLAPREWRCVSLMGHLVKEGLPRYPENAVRELVSLEEGEQIRGILLFTATGILLHSLSEDFDGAAFRRPIASFLSALNVRCVLGEASGGRYLESFLRLSPDRAVDYRLLTLPRRTEPLTSAQIAIELGTDSDALGLLPLQEGYEREEVIPPGDPFNRDQCLAQLKRNLANQRIYVARQGGKPVAKAGTNARGLTWDQLGGVYTVPEARGRGYAKAVVSTLASDLMADERKVALFVKNANAAALRVYRAIGFTPDTEFRISYY